MEKGKIVYALNVAIYSIWLLLFLFMMSDQFFDGDIVAGLFYLLFMSPFALFIFYSIKKYSKYDLTSKYFKRALIFNTLAILIPLLTFLIVYFDLYKSQVDGGYDSFFILLSSLAVGIILSIVSAISFINASNSSKEEQLK